MHVGVTDYIQLTYSYTPYIADIWMIDTVVHHRNHLVLWTLELQVEYVQVLRDISQKRQIGMCRKDGSTSGETSLSFSATNGAVSKKYREKVRHVGNIGKEIGGKFRQLK